MSASVLLRSSHIFSSLISPKCFRNGSCLDPHHFPLARQRHRLTSLLRYKPTCRLVVFSPAPTSSGRCRTSCKPQSAFSWLVCQELEKHSCWALLARNLRVFIYL